MKREKKVEERYEPYFKFVYKIIITAIVWTWWLFATITFTSSWIELRFGHKKGRSRMVKPIENRERNFSRERGSVCLPTHQNQVSFLGKWSRNVPRQNLCCVFNETAHVSTTDKLYKQRSVYAVLITPSPLANIAFFHRHFNDHVTNTHVHFINKIQLCVTALIAIFFFDHHFFPHFHTKIFQIDTKKKFEINFSSFWLVHKTNQYEYF